MRKLSVLVLTLFCLSLYGCGSGYEINGSTMKTAFRSIKSIKERLPPEKRIQFEVAFGIIRDNYKDDGEFLDQVDDKNPDQIIDSGKQIFDQYKNQGSKDFEKFGSWEDMINQFMTERSNQDRNRKDDPRAVGKQETILYKLNNM